LRLAIDATPLTEGTSGIARYTAELARALSREFPEDEYWLLSDQALPAGLEAPGLRVEARRRTGWRRRWWLAGLPAELVRGHFDAFHGTDFGVPYLPLKPAVLTFHDTSPWREGDERAEAAERVRRRTPYLLRLATMIITPTEAVRREVVERFGVSRQRTAAIPLAASEFFRPATESEVERVRRAWGLDTPYILFLGATERRKNLTRLAAAWREARGTCPELQLAVVGRAARNTEVLNFGGGPKPVVTGPLPDAEVAALLTGAVALVYPSLYEGFGLPVLEAMQAGTPVIVSEDAALREVAGEAAVRVDAWSVHALARAIVELTRDPNWRRRLRERGLERAAQFSWRRTARETREVYVEAVRRF
jgi:glycosyltransferase involved in cell wall biosynthesis